MEKTTKLILGLTGLAISGILVYFLLTKAPQLPQQPSQPSKPSISASIEEVKIVRNGS